MRILELKGVSVLRGNSWLLKSIDWVVEEGERWVIVGPNGAGKTTLLSLLSAQLYPTVGTVQLLGETLGRVDVFVLRPRIGVCSSHIARRIPGDERVCDVVVSAVRAVIGRGREVYSETDFLRAAQLLREFHIEQFADRRFGTLSDGERKRVEIARALMGTPELLLLDEPGAGLDLAGRESLVVTLAELTSNPTSPAVVLVTHHMEEIPDGITHALLLADGGIVASGVVNEVLTSELLSRTYHMPLRLSHLDGRWAARADTVPCSRVVG
ncbi:MAG: ABC transporter ATP-binding protein [Propionibacteriaceae bacterium]|jgi:iron complex transport system ATP-binding protein|nr:ABC transporter ATP-binding protein [Propionibacteriaceae bacterium]